MSVRTQVTHHVSHLHAVGEEAPMGDENTFLKRSADITHRQITGQSGTHTSSESGYLANSLLKTCTGFSFYSSGFTHPPNTHACQGWKVTSRSLGQEPTLCRGHHCGAKTHTHTCTLTGSHCLQCIPQAELFLHGQEPTLCRGHHCGANTHT